MKTTIVFIAAATLAGTAAAGTFFSEVESNNTIATANDIGIFDSPGGAMTLEGLIDQGDVDWFGFTLANTATLSFFAGFGTSGDGLMQIVAAGGDVIAFDDDSGIGLMPAIQIENLSAGTYYLSFSGFGDVDAGSVASDELADGLGHSENFAYKISVGFSVVPAPSALALMGLGGIVITRRRR